jgi:hypothetical protein
MSQLNPAELAYGSDKTGLVGISVRARRVTAVRRRE